MKMIQAIIRREKLQAVQQALEAVQAPGMTMWEIEGHGKQKGVTESFRGREIKVSLLPKTKIEIVVDDAKVRQVVETIVKAAATGQVGDGKVFVTNVEEAVRIRTAERGEVAVR